MLDDLKARVFQVVQKAMQKQLGHELGINFSAKDPESGNIVITPRDLSVQALQPTAMVVIDPAGNVIEGENPSAEVPMHVGIYRARPEIGAIAHTHSAYATAFAMLGEQIPCGIAIQELEFGESIPVVPEAATGTEEMAKAVLPYLDKHKGVLLRNHGTLTVGRTIEEAFNRATYLEELATVCHHAYQVRTPMTMDMTASDRDEKQRLASRGGERTV